MLESYCIVWYKDPNFYLDTFHGKQQLYLTFVKHVHDVKHQISIVSTYLQYPVLQLGNSESPHSSIKLAWLEPEKAGQEFHSPIEVIKRNLQN